tara:strand:+ start:523674 stop:525206 length:1533 start_codon:yes stop_codon:yes gene_type:complete
MKSELAPSYTQFEHLYNKGETQIVYLKYNADFDTALGAYYKITKDKPYSLLLESVEGGAHIGRYSIIASNPDQIWQVTQGLITTSNAQGETILSEAISADNTPIDSLRAHIKQCHISAIPDDIPPVCTGGLFGYLGYEMVRYYESSIPDENADTLDIPEAVMMRPQMLAVFDNVKHELTLAVPILKTAQNSTDSAQSCYDHAKHLIDQACSDLQGALPVHMTQSTTKLSLPLKTKRNFTDETFKDVVRAAKDHIYAGDVFQVVPSQRFRVDFDLPAIELYRSLRQINPSPFLFHLKMDGFTLVGSSPEILVRVQNNEVTIRPIAGTRPRGATPEEDSALADELLVDEKERAEHLMLIDLGRNDVGRVAKIGSVRVSEQFTIERYSHVMHIVSNVVGALKDDLDCLDALFSGFPAGTVSGAPKVRAMQLIHKFENEKRSFYAGCIGYFDGQGNMDTCIALRTALVKNGEIIMQAGAGIVADSDPESENQECKNKAKALVSAAEAVIRNHTV